MPAVPAAALLDPVVLLGEERRHVEVPAVGVERDLRPSHELRRLGLHEPVAHEGPKRVGDVLRRVAAVDGVEVDHADRHPLAPDDVPGPEVAVADRVIDQHVVEATQEVKDRAELVVVERHAQRRVADIGMQAAALGERLALDPGEDFAALLIRTQPARRAVESGSRETEKDVAGELRVRTGRAAHRVADAHHAFRQRAADECELLLPVLVSRG